MPCHSALRFSYVGNDTGTLVVVGTMGIFQRRLDNPWKKEKTPTPKTRFSIWTLLRTPGRFTTRPLPAHFYHKNVRSKAVFGR